MKKIFILLSFLFSFGIFAQTKVKVSPKDSAAIMKLWEKFVFALERSDSAFIAKNSVKIVDCYCGTTFVDQDINKWPAKKFAAQMIKRYVESKKLQEVICDQSPHVSISAYNKTKHPSIFSVVYVLYKAGELGPKHEGAGMFFDFIKKGKSLKLYAVWTIP